MKHTRTRLILALGLALVMVLAACNGGEEEATVTPEPVGDVDVTEEVEMTEEATEEATEAVEMTEEAETTEEAVESTFSVEITGDLDASISDEGGEYSFDFEEPGGEADADVDIQPMTTGMYTMHFVNAEGDVEVFVSFSDNFQVGTYPVEIGAVDAEDSDALEVLFARVETADVSYTETTDGEITFDRFGDDLVSGSFQFELTPAEEEGTITLTGSFENLPLETIPAEAGDTTGS